MALISYFKLGEDQEYYEEKSLNFILGGNNFSAGQLDFTNVNRNILGAVLSGYLVQISQSEYYSIIKNETIANPLINVSSSYLITLSNAITGEPNNNALIFLLQDGNWYNLTWELLKAYIRNGFDNAVSTDSTLEGNGNSGTPLKIAQQGANDSQALLWDIFSETWVPKDIPISISQIDPVVPADNIGVCFALDNTQVSPVPVNNNLYTVNPSTRNICSTLNCVFYASVEDLAIDLEGLNSILLGTMGPVDGVAIAPTNINTIAFPSHVKVDEYYINPSNTFQPGFQRITHGSIIVKPNSSGIGEIYAYFSGESTMIIPASSEGENYIVFPVQVSYPSKFVAL